MSISNNYDSIAGIYDFLGRMVYGNTLFRSQLVWLEHLPRNKRILVLGGGTGRILQPLLAQAQPEKIVYVEKSLRMLEKSKRNLPAGYEETVVFVHGTQADIVHQQFDIVLTNYFFDQFTWWELARIFLETEKMLVPGGHWLWTDFVAPRKWWQRLLLWLMQVFFRLTTRLPATEIYPLQELFGKRGYASLHQKTFYGGFMASVLFVRKIPKE